jgi:hypothetical protein
LIGRLCRSELRATAYGYLFVAADRCVCLGFGAKPLRCRLVRP